MSIFPALLLAGIIAAPASGRVNTARLRWTDPMGRRPTTYKAWAGRASVCDAETHSGLVLNSGDNNVVEVVVNAAVYPKLVAELTQYSTDLESAGYSVRIDTMRGTSPQALRALLQGVANITGALLVGDVPVAWYESDWGGGQPEEFPCDLYFADLDGTWIDADHDGLFDDHQGNVAPEIWVGRLYASPLTWDDEVRLYKRYFQKDHLYRTGGLSAPDRALAFNDDDWAPSGNQGLTAIYDTVNVIEDSRTTATNYRTEMVKGYEWIHVMAHSSPWGHTFKDGNGGYTGTVFNCEIYALQPRALFYNLFACSGARFVEENYSAGWDIFNDDWGLAAVGSTKTGSMFGYFEDFYSPLGAGQSIGDAFKSWFTTYGEQSRDWHYGLSILGDPTLKPRHGNARRASPPAVNLQSSISNHQSSIASPSPTPDPRSLSPLPQDIVCPDSETDADPHAAADANGRVWVVWVSGRSTTDGRFDIYSSYRDPGSQWAPAMTIGPDEYWDCDPAIGIDSAGKPVAVWANFEDSYHYNIHYSYWTGSGWSPQQSFPDDAASDYKPCLVRDSSGRLWCFWESRQDYFSNVYSAYWNDSAWSTPENVTHDSADEHNPCAVTDHNGRVWVFFARAVGGSSQIWGSYRSGSNWIQVGPISTGQTRAAHPACCTSGPEGGEAGIWVAWQAFDSDDGEIYVSQYNDTAWSVPFDLSQSAGPLDVHPAMACDPLGRPWVVWQHGSRGDWSLMTYCRMYNEWRQENVSMPWDFNVNPTLADDGGEMCFVWQAYQPGGNWEISVDYAGYTDVREPARTQPLSHAQLRAFPNPAQGSVRFECRCPNPCAISITDISGRWVRTLAGSSGESQAVVWDGRNEAGRKVGPGVYVARLTSKAGATQAKVVLTR